MKQSSMFIFRKIGVLVFSLAFLGMASPAFAGNFVQFNLLTSNGPLPNQPTSVLFKCTGSFIASTINSFNPVTGLINIFVSDAVGGGCSGPSTILDLKINATGFESKEVQAPNFTGDNSTLNMDSVTLEIQNTGSTPAPGTSAQRYVAAGQEIPPSIIQQLKDRGQPIPEPLPPVQTPEEFSCDLISSYDPKNPKDLNISAVYTPGSVKTTFFATKELARKDLVKSTVRKTTYNLEGVTVFEVKLLCEFAGHILEKDKKFIFGIENNAQQMQNLMQGIAFLRVDVDVFFGKHFERILGEDVGKEGNFEEIVVASLHAIEHDNQLSDEEKDKARDKFLEIIKNGDPESNLKIHEQEFVLNREEDEFKNEHLGVKNESFVVEREGIDIFTLKFVEGNQGVVIQREKNEDEENAGEFVEDVLNSFRLKNDSKRENRFVEEKDSLPPVQGPEEFLCELAITKDADSKGFSAIAVTSPSGVRADISAIVDTKLGRSSSAEDSLSMRVETASMVLVRLECEYEGKKVLRENKFFIGIHDPVGKLNNFLKALIFVNNNITVDSVLMQGLMQNFLGVNSSHIKDQPNASEQMRDYYKTLVEDMFTNGLRVIKEDTSLSEDGKRELHDKFFDILENGDPEINAGPEVVFSLLMGADQENKDLENTQDSKLPESEESKLLTQSMSLESFSSSQEFPLKSDVNPLVKNFNVQFLRGNLAQAFFPVKPNVNPPTAQIVDPEPARQCFAPFKLSMKEGLDRLAEFVLDQDSAFYQTDINATTNSDMKALVDCLERIGFVFDGVEKGVLYAQLETVFGPGTDAPLGRLVSSVIDDVAVLLGFSNQSLNNASESEKFLMMKFALTPLSVEGKTLSTYQKLEGMDFFVKNNKKFPVYGSDYLEVLKTLSGIFPNQRDLNTEKDSAKVFEKIYLRAPNMENIHDKNAVFVLSYGLMPLDSNIDKEAFAKNVFQSVFGRTAELSDMHVVRAIAYSGATR